VTAFLTLKCTDVITKEHFLDFWVFLEHNPTVIISKLLIESFSICEVFCLILLWFSLVKLVMHTIQHIS
jgi:hypothetical protein